MSQPKKNIPHTISQPKKTITHTVSHSTTTTTKPKPEDKTDYTGLFNALSPLVLFVLGYLFNNYLDKRKETSRLKDIEEYLYRVLPDLVNSIDEQLTEINNVITKAKVTTDLSDLRIPEVATLRATKLKGINDTDLFKIFVSNNHINKEQAIDDYRAITSSVDYIDSSLLILHTISQSNINNQQLFAKAFEEPFNKITQISFELVDRLQKNSSDTQAQAVLNLLNERIAALQTTTSQLNAKGSTDINTHIIQPLLAYFAANSPTGYYVDIALNIRKAANEYNGLNNYKQEIDTALSAISSKLNLYSVNLKDIITRYSGSRKSNFFTRLLGN